MTYVIYETLMLVFRIIELAALVSIILSWVMPMSKFKGTIDWLLSPIMYPFRWLNMKLVSRIQIPLDFSYLFMLIGIDVARIVVARVLGIFI